MLSKDIALTVFDEVYRVGPLLGQGGEGIVHSVVDNESVPRFALKWYHRHTAYPSRWDNLRDLADRGAPGPGFLWPLAVIAADDGSQFGYVMHLRPDDFVGLTRVLSGEVNRTDRMITNAGSDLARGFYALHAAGLCYRDVNFGNVFIHRVDGRVLICDNDNVGVDGASAGSVAGTPKFMAPEIVRGEAEPSAATDRFSLAVLLFYLLMVGHPLEGSLTEDVLADDDAHQRFHGLEPRFCFDPADDTNRPHPEFHEHVPQLWNSLPGFVQDLFMTSFTRGLVDPSCRVRDSEWFQAMVRLGDHLTICSSCREERFIDPERLDIPCPWCDHRESTLMTLRLAISNTEIVVIEGAELAEHHLTFDLRDSATVGRIETRPTRPDVVGLRNVSGSAWQVTPIDGAPFELSAGRVARLQPGTKIDIGVDRLEVVVKDLN